MFPNAQRLKEPFFTQWHTMAGGLSKRKSWLSWDLSSYWRYDAFGTSRAEQRREHPDSGRSGLKIDLTTSYRWTDSTAVICS